MASSDEEGEILPHCVTNYHLISGNEDVSLSILPLQLSDSVVSETFNKQVFLHGSVDSDNRETFKEVTAWKFKLSNVHPEILVLSRSKNWIQLQKPRRGYADIIKSILVTVYLLHLAKRNPDAAAGSLWKHLQNLFSAFNEGPSEKDILQHIKVISVALSVDKDLIRSKYLLDILKRSHGKDVMPSERDHLSPTKRNFEVDDDDDDDDDDDSDAADDKECEDDEDEVFDRVCSFCDDGGNLLCCDGRCLRSFHATREDGIATGCESLGLTDEQVNAMKSFKCQNCKDQRHQCFACGMLGSSDAASGAEVFPCISATCGHFYHPECVVKLIHPMDSTKAANLQRQIVMGESFTCPAHRCFSCKEVEDKTFHDLQFAVCRRCPTSYHRKCMPKRISFECTNDIPTRAWDGLLKNRILIYCLKHRINRELKTPDRDHILFSDTRRSGINRTSQLFRGKNTWDSKKILPQNNIGFNISRPDNGSSKKVERGMSQACPGPSNYLNCRFASHPSNHSGIHPKAHWSSIDARTGHLSASSKLAEELLGGNRELREKQGTGIGKRKIEDREMMCESTSWPDRAALEERIAAFKKKCDASFDEKKFRSQMSIVSTHSSYSRNMLDVTIPQGRLDASVKAVRAALQKLDEGGTLEEAKAICEPQILNQIMMWKRKLGIYLAPFLHGKRYTSYGRHFTKFEKLQEVVNRLHHYVLNGDTIVDFCCGSNDFSCLMKKKLYEMGKCCSFKNYDIIQPKNDFCFEKRDWMSVTPNELPTGCKLIMGLNPPFGVKATLANKFINKALEFKPKLIILIVPEETKRLDDKCAYDLIWEDRRLFEGKSFYLPGSVDIHNNQIEQWNNSPPPLYLWSRSDWSNAHRSIAKQYGHAFMQQRESNERCDRVVSTISDYLMEERRDCHEDFSHIIPDEDISRTLDDITEPDCSNESEPDEVPNYSEPDCSNENQPDEVPKDKRKHSAISEVTAPNGEYSCLPIEKRVEPFVFEANSSTPDLWTPVQSNRSLCTGEHGLTVSQTNTKLSCSVSMKPEMISTTQGFYNYTPSVPAGSDSGSKAEINQLGFQDNLHIPSVSAAVEATNIHPSVNTTSADEAVLAAASGLGNITHSGWQPNFETQPYGYVPPAPWQQDYSYGAMPPAPWQQDYSYGAMPRGNTMPNEGYGYYYPRARFPQVLYGQYVPQYSSGSYGQYVPQYSTGVAPFFQNADRDDDLPPIPGLGPTPRLPYPRP